MRLDQLLHLSKWNSFISGWFLQSIYSCHICHSVFKQISLILQINQYFPSLWKPLFNGKHEAIYPTNMLMKILSPRLCWFVKLNNFWTEFQIQVWYLHLGLVICFITAAVCAHQQVLILPSEKRICLPIFWPIHIHGDLSRRRRPVPEMVAVAN